MIVCIHPIGNSILECTPHKVHGAHNIVVASLYNLTLLNNVGPQNVTVGFWELIKNLSLPAQLSEHPSFLFQGPFERARSVEYCYEIS